ncbi:MAG: NnrS family protein [Candidatus Eisenbacteria bacterium]|uniref:NnrS family protein n=1 Tax=Eiseniibacteriota bacterium TaxID=2212470 RepID=A0A849SI61_UNCEI|nr:NnrS family protein [Candidatus Eisenbacteria bacterium]
MIVASDAQAPLGTLHGTATEWPDPYRILFPLGIAFAIAGVAPWIRFGAEAIPSAGSLHMALMIEGFEQSFVLGFLLTALPAFTRGARCARWELAMGALLLAAFALFAFTGPGWAAELAYAASVALIGWALTSRIVRVRRLPPEEFLFVGVGLLLGLCGAAVMIASQRLGWAPTSPRLGERLHSLGMTLSIVLGVGGLLVPTFSGIREPLRVPGIAGAHERDGRRRLYVPVALALIGAFALEAIGLARTGAFVRAVAASVLLLLVWKLWRRPQIKGPVPISLWASGWILLLGLWFAALWPSLTLAAYHIVFVGGFGFLTIGIGTRVTVAHGKHPLSAEPRLMTPLVFAAMVLALVVRVAAELMLHPVNLLRSASAVLWMLAWALWASRALPRMLKLAHRPQVAPRVQV